jgi:hypothetical protein
VKEGHKYINAMSVHWANGRRESYPIVGESVEYASRQMNTCPPEQLLHLGILSRYALRKSTTLGSIISRIGAYLVKGR